MQNGCPNQASYQAGMKWPIKKERTHGGKEKKKRNSKQKTTTLLSEKKEEAGNVSEERVKG